MDNFYAQWAQKLSDELYSTAQEPEEQQGPAPTPAMAAAKVPPGNAGRKRSQPAPVQVKEEVTDQLLRAVAGCPARRSTGATGEAPCLQLLQLLGKCNAMYVQGLCL